MAFDLSPHLNPSEEIVFNQGCVYVTNEPAEHNGQEKTWIRVYYKPAVQIFPVAASKKIWLIREFRPVEGTERWMVPSGAVDDNEDIIDSAQRELREELGFSGKLELFATMPYEKKSYNNLRYFFIARNLVEDPLPNPDGDVILEKKEFELDELKRMVIEGQFDWSPLAFAILRLHRDVAAGRIVF
ncbi:NUDIX hydrolase [Candidatus Woesearchaeota archaeon]|nr:NUDIX hydrolase [Candidatus Woesearchaeota archaeon]